jgi:hypothetical protein
MGFNRYETLLSGVSAAGSSGWVDIQALEERTAQVEFAAAPAGDTVEIHGRNDVEKPGSAVDGKVLATFNAQFDIQALALATRWVKAKKTGTAQPVTVIIGGASR